MDSILYKNLVSSSPSDGLSSRFSCTTNRHSTNTSLRAACCEATPYELVKQNPLQYYLDQRAGVGYPRIRGCLSREGGD